MKTKKIITTVLVLALSICGVASTQKVSNATIKASPLYVTLNYYREEPQKERVVASKNWSKDDTTNFCGGTSYGADYTRGTKYVALEQDDPGNGSGDNDNFITADLKPKWSASAEWRLRAYISTANKTKTVLLKTSLSYPSFYRTENGSESCAAIDMEPLWKYTCKLRTGNTSYNKGSQIIKVEAFSNKAGEVNKKRYYIRQQGSPSNKADVINSCNLPSIAIHAR